MTNLEAVYINSSMYINSASKTKKKSLINFKTESCLRWTKYNSIQLFNKDIYHIEAFFSGCVAKQVNRTNIYTLCTEQQLTKALCSPIRFAKRVQKSQCAIFSMNFGIFLAALRKTARNFVTINSTEQLIRVSFWDISTTARRDGFRGGVERGTNFTTKIFPSKYKGT